MGFSGAAGESGGTALLRLSEGLLSSAGRTGVHGHLLEIHHPAAPQFDPVFLHTASESHGVAISLNQRDAHCAGQRVRCVSSQLPFQGQVFQMVVLHHVIATGEEPELAEAVRVLARTGVLLLLGLNRFGWRYRAQGGGRGRLPGLAPMRVRKHLQALGMTMQGYAGAGLAGLPGPAFMSRGLGGLGAPLADLVLLQARRYGSPELTPLRFSKARASVVQSAAIGG